MTAPAALRAALRRYERSRFAPAVAGADLAACLPGRRYWIEALEAGFLALDGAAVRLTAAGLASASPCATCGWTSCRGSCARAAAAPQAPRERPATHRWQPSGASNQGKKAAKTVEIAASDLAVTLEKLPQGFGETMKGVRRRQGELYRRRAARALFQAVRAFERTFFAPIQPGTDLAGRLLGKKRYWQGGGGAAGYLQGTKITAEGIAAARAYLPPSRPAPAPALGAAA